MGIVYSFIGEASASSAALSCVNSSTAQPNGLRTCDTSIGEVLSERPLGGLEKVVKPELKSLDVEPGSLCPVCPDAADVLLPLSVVAEVKLLPSIRVPLRTIRHTRWMGAWISDVSAS